MKKILTIGSAIQDIFIEYENPQAKTLGDSFLETRSYSLVAEGCKIEVKEIKYATGGGGTNSAISFAKLGFDVTSFFKIGDDPEGNYIIEQLTQQKVTINYLTTTEHKTGRSFILPSPTGNQPILAYRGANAFLKPSELPLERLSNFDFLYVTSLSGKSSESLLPLAKTAHEMGILIATNPGTSQLALGAEKLRPALPYISILLLNATEASQLMFSFLQDNKYTKPTRSFENNNMPKLLAQPITYQKITYNLVDFFKTIHKNGPSMVIVTNGAEGVYLSDQKTIYFQASIPTHIVSTVGAGDAFGSCFIASILNNQSIEQSLVKGIINASSVISNLDAKTGLLSNNELSEKVKKNTIEKTYKESL